MHFPRFWARAVVDEHGLETDRSHGYVAFGWSDASHEQAHRMAVDRAARLARYLNEPDPHRLADPSPGPPLGDYYDRPLREAVVDELTIDGQTHAVVSRNAYGAYVLNTAAVLFADIDPPPRPLVKATFWQRLLGAGDLVAARDDRTDDQKCDETFGKVEPVLADLGLAGRLYRTAAGFRLAVTSRLYQPESAESNALLQSLDSDPRYVDLCRAQRCYRARVSPKPWRVRLDRPPARYPFATPHAEREFEWWDARYQTTLADHAACRPLADLGNAPPDPVAARVLTLHDELACTGKPLA